MVLLRNSRRDTKKGDKMTPRWLGPYRICEALGIGAHKIRNPVTGKVLKAAVNQCRLKLYFKGTPVSLD